MALATAMESGLAGALALTAIHETARKNVHAAPRMDVLGKRALLMGARAISGRTLPAEHLHEITMLGDVAANSLYYSLVALGKPEGAVVRGALLGLAAGVGAVVLPGPMGLGATPSNRTNATRAMTVAWYTLGGVAAGAAYRLLARRQV